MRFALLVSSARAVKTLLLQGDFYLFASLVKLKLIKYRTSKKRWFQLQRKYDKSFAESFLKQLIWCVIYFSLEASLQTSTARILKKKRQTSMCEIVLKSLIYFSWQTLIFVLLLSLPPHTCFPLKLLTIRDQREVAATQVRTQQVATMATQHMQRKQLSCHWQPCEPHCYQQLICLPSFVITNCNRLRAQLPCQVITNVLPT